MIGDFNKETYDHFSLSKIRKVGFQSPDYFKTIEIIQYDDGLIRVLFRLEKSGNPEFKKLWTNIESNIEKEVKDAIIRCPIIFVYMEKQHDLIKLETFLSILDKWMVIKSIKERIIANVTEYLPCKKQLPVDSAPESKNNVSVKEEKVEVREDNQEPIKEEQDVLDVPILTVSEADATAIGNFLIKKFIQDSFRLLTYLSLSDITCSAELANRIGKEFIRCSNGEQVSFDDVVSSLVNLIIHEKTNYRDRFKKTWYLQDKMQLQIYTEINENLSEAFSKEYFEEIFNLLFNCEDQIRKYYNIFLVIASALNKEFNCLYHSTLQKSIYEISATLSANKELEKIKQKPPIIVNSLKDYIIISKDDSSEIPSVLQIHLTTPFEKISLPELYALQSIIKDMHYTKINYKKSCLQKIQNEINKKDPGYRFFSNGIIQNNVDYFFSGTVRPEVILNYHTLSFFELMNVIDQIHPDVLIYCIVEQEFNPLNHAKVERYGQLEVLLARIASKLKPAFLYHLVSNANIPLITPAMIEILKKSLNDREVLSLMVLKNSLLNWLYNESIDETTRADQFVLMLDLRLSASQKKLVCNDELLNRWLDIMIPYKKTNTNVLGYFILKNRISDSKLYESILSKITSKALIDLWNTIGINSFYISMMLFEKIIRNLDPEDRVTIFKKYHFYIELPMYQPSYLILNTLLEIIVKLPCDGVVELFNRTPELKKLLARGHLYQDALTELKAFPDKLALLEKYHDEYCNPRFNSSISWSQGEKNESKETTVLKRTMFFPPKNESQSSEYFKSVIQKNIEFIIQKFSDKFGDDCDSLNLGDMLKIRINSQTPDLVFSEAKDMLALLKACGVINTDKLSLQYNQLGYNQFVVIQIPRSAINQYELSSQQPSHSSLKQNGK